jgi:predicted MPP superfamily phosphohydrolase
MGRGKYYHRWRKIGEGLEAAIYRENWAAKLAYAVGLQGRLAIDRRELRLAQPLPVALRLAIISDLHAGPLTDARLFMQVAKAVEGFAPHLILLGGDYVSLHARHIVTLLPALRKMTASHGIFGVYGNHDLWLDGEHIGRQLSEAGVAMLVNENRRLPAPFDMVSVCGLDEPGVGEPDALAAFAGAEAVRLLLMHSPLGLRRLRGQRFDLALCGHTHGGQIALPGGHPVLLPPGSGERRHASGYFALAPGQTLLTSRGIGMSDLPLRLFAPSEVHLLTLR